MKFHRWQRTLILALLSLSVVAPLIFVTHRLKVLTPNGLGEFLDDDLSSVTYRTDPLKLNAIEQEGAAELEEPKQVVYKENEFSSTVDNSSKYINNSEESRIEGSRNKLVERNVSELDHGKGLDQEAQQKEFSSMDGDKKKSNVPVSQNSNVHSHSQRMMDENNAVTDEQSGRKAKRHQISHSHSHRVTNQKIEEMKDQIIRAKAYLSLTPPNSNSHLVKELKLRIKEMEKLVIEATRDSDLPKSVLQKMRYMEASLSKAHRAFPDCSAMIAELRAMNHNAEEQLRAQRYEATYLIYLAARTSPKGLHCLSMRLTANYFALRPEERRLPNENKIHDPELYHYAVFSDNVLACAVVVNSTVSTAKEQEKVVFHVVTNSLNFPAVSMWFLLNPPGKATVHIQSIDNFEWFSKYNTFMKYNSSDPRYSSELNYLRFYLPELFPALNKIVLFDHDVVVQQDLTGLWNVNMNGKVIAAVGTCQEGETSYHRMDMFINFSDPFIEKRFDVNACTWAFGMNLFDLKQWRRHNLTAVYRKYLLMGSARPLWNIGSLPIGWLTFYKRTMFLDRQWQVLGLGYDSGVHINEIERAAVIHYDGIRKPWLDIAVGRYKSYWTKFLNFDHPFMQQCNLQA